MSDETTYASGNRVRFTSGPLGLLEEVGSYKFAEATAVEGDEGEVVTNPGAMPDGWLLVRHDASGKYAPVHPSMIEPL